MKIRNESAVSPVIAVMLMLVVTIIIAAVVSAFAGGLTGGHQKAPQLTMDVHISNNGYWSGSAFSARVTGVESAIPTSDLEITTHWVHTNRSDGIRTEGGEIVVPGQNNTFLHWSPWRGASNMGDYYGVAPWGYGMGVGDQEASAGTGSGQGYQPTNFFGNYSLAVGTVMWAEPFGANTRPTAGGYSGVAYDIGYGVGGHPFSYTYGDSRSCNGGDCAHLYQGVNTDGLMAVLGQNWSVLRAGDIVTVGITHIPSGATIWQKDVTVED
jgi:FlaG/FlaF family flagellin (archaellin)